jgi:amino acid transporter
VLSAWEGAAIGIGVAVGAGIFRTPGYVAGYFSSPGGVLLVWGLGTLLVIGDCLVLAELATRVPRAGGWYAYIEQGWGRFPAFVYGWTYMLVVDPASSAALVVVLVSSSPRSSDGRRAQGSSRAFRSRWVSSRCRSRGSGSAAASRTR